MISTKNGLITSVIFRKAHRLWRQIEMSHIKEIRHSENSAFTPVRPQENLNPMIPFAQSKQSQ